MEQKSHSKKNRSLKNLLLMPKVQLKYIYYLVAIVAMPMSVLLAFTVTELHKLKLEVMALNNYNPDVIGYIEVASSRLSVAVCLIFVLIVVMAFVGVLLVSHRFVGPIYVINKYIEAMKKGDFEFHRELRKEDEMQETLALLKDLGKKLNTHEENS